MRVGDLYNRIKTIIVSVVVLIGAVAPIFVSETVFANGGYPYSSAADCSGRYGAYSWCMPGDDYLSPLGYAYRNCTDWVAWKTKSHILGRSPTGLGNGGSWDNNAPSRGFVVKYSPEPGDAAVWEGTSSNPYGHVAFVESVNSDGTVNISEYNYGTRGQFGQRFGVRANKYVDFDGVGVISYITVSSSTSIYSMVNKYGLKYSQVSDVPLTGDWNGDGQTDIGVNRGNTFYLRMKDGSVSQFNFGNGISAGDIPIVGNWDGIGGDEVGVVRGMEFYLRSSSGSATVVKFGNGISAGDIPLAGDWNGDGKDEPTIYRSITFYGKLPNSTYQKSYGNGISLGDIPIVGNWDGIGGDEVGVVRGNSYYRYTQQSVNFGNPVQASL
jgi:surface antigen